MTPAREALLNFGSTSRRQGFMEALEKALQTIKAHTTTGCLTLHEGVDEDGNLIDLVDLIPSDEDRGYNRAIQHCLIAVQKLGG